MISVLLLMAAQSTRAPVPVVANICAVLRAGFLDGLECPPACPAPVSSIRPWYQIADLDGDGRLDLVAFVCPSGRAPTGALTLEWIRGSDPESKGRVAAGSEVEQRLGRNRDEAFLAIIFGSDKITFIPTARSTLIANAWCNPTELFLHFGEVPAYYREDNVVVLAPQLRSPAVAIHCIETRVFDLIYWSLPDKAFRAHPVE